MGERYVTYQQHEPLRTPPGWDAKEKRLIAQLEEIIDDLYRRFNRIKLGDLSEGLRTTITDTAGNTAQLLIDAQSIRTNVSSIEGDISTISQTAESLQARVSNNEGDISTLQQTAEGFETRVSNNEGNITQLQQTASSLSARVTSAAFRVVIEATKAVFDLSTDSITLTARVYDEDTEITDTLDAGLFVWTSSNADWSGTGKSITLSRTDVNGYGWFTCTVDAGDGALAAGVYLTDGEALLTDENGALLTI